MGFLIKKLAIYAGKKVAKIDPSDIMTQDTMKTVFDIVKEVLL